MLIVDKWLWSFVILLVVSLVLSFTVGSRSQNEDPPLSLKILIIADIVFGVGLLTSIITRIWLS